MTTTRVIPIAQTQWTNLGPLIGQELGWEPDPLEGSSGEQLAEFAGRACYQSWNKPGKDTATTAGYLAHILEVQHLSVLEHASVTFYIIDGSRSFTHELVRHRHLSYSQLSQRYVNEPVTAEHRVVPPLFEGDDRANQFLEHAAKDARATYELLVERGEELARARGYEGTLAHKRAREAARAVLPNMTPTSIVVTGNFRAWLWFLEKRHDMAADLEIYGIAKMIAEHLHIIAPNVFPEVSE